jgi:hypothetical protein
MDFQNKPFNKEGSPVSDSRGGSPQQENYNNQNYNNFENGLNASAGK